MIMIGRVAPLRFEETRRSAGKNAGHHGILSKILEKLGIGGPAELTGDSAQMNMWLHNTVLAQIAANGGNVPRELLN
jgi:hypothetical protein